MDQASDLLGYGFSYAYKDAQGKEFALTSGNRTVSPVEPIYVPGEVDVNDTVVIGSGTKSYTATAIMRLVE